MIILKVWNYVQDAHHGHSESRREQVRFQEKLTVNEKVFQEIQIEMFMSFNEKSSGHTS